MTQLVRTLQKIGPSYLSQLSRRGPTAKRRIASSLLRLYGTVFPSSYAKDNDWHATTVPHRGLRRDLVKAVLGLGKGDLSRANDAIQTEHLVRTATSQGRLSTERLVVGPVGVGSALTQLGPIYVREGRTLEHLDRNVSPYRYKEGISWPWPGESQDAGSVHPGYIIKWPWPDSPPVDAPPQDLAPGIVDPWANRPRTPPPTDDDDGGGDQILEGYSENSEGEEEEEDEDGVDWWGLRATKDGAESLANGEDDDDDWPLW